MCYVDNTIVVHFVAEDTFTVPDLPAFTESTMKATLLKSSIKVNNEIDVRAKEFGKLIVVGSFPDGMISMYYKEFFQALNTR